MIAYTTPHVQIGAVLLRTKAYDCYDWSDLFAYPTKRGRDRVVPGVAGESVRPRVTAALRCVLPVRLRGDFNANNVPQTSDTHLRVYDHLAALDVMVAPNVTQTLTFTYGAKTSTADCIVEGRTAPRFESPWIAVVVLDVTLPDGPMSL